MRGIKVRLQNRLPARNETLVAQFPFLKIPERTSDRRLKPGSSCLEVSRGHAASHREAPCTLAEQMWKSQRFGTLTSGWGWQWRHSAPFSQSNKGISCPPL